MPRGSLDFFKNTDEDDEYDYQDEENEEMYFDHQAGHVAFPCSNCPYCDDRDENVDIL